MTRLPVCNLLRSVPSMHWVILQQPHVCHKRREQNIPEFKDFFFLNAFQKGDLRMKLICINHLIVHI